MLTGENLQHMAEDLVKRMKKHGGSLDEANAVVALTCVVANSPRTIAVVLRTEKNIAAFMKVMEEVGLI